MSRLILADRNIPAVREAFGGFGEVQLFDGRQLRSQDLRDADVLLVRSVTRVNEALLAESPVRFVGSTTIGTDHLDIEWLERSGIAWCNAPGCNAEAVVDYCLSAFCRVPGVLERLLAGAPVGIVGFGNVGSRLYRRLRALDINCLAYDPFIDQSQCPVKAPLEALLDCAVLSLHAPLTDSGPHPTRHMLELDSLLRLPEQAMVLNAGRGEVLATGMLKALAAQRPDIALVLDVWENEPLVDRELRAACRLATPHIAGYSQDGKLNGLRQVLEVYSRHIGEAAPALDSETLLGPAPFLQLRERGGAALIREAVLACYDIAADHARWREARADREPARVFDEQRRHYPPRRELRACRADAGNLSTAQRQLLQALGIAA